MSNQRGHTIQSFKICFYLVITRWDFVYILIAWLPGRGMLGPGKASKGCPQIPNIPPALTCLVVASISRRIMLLLSMVYLIVTLTCTKVYPVE